MSVSHKSMNPSLASEELKRLITIADDGFILGWIVELHETLSEVSEQALDIASKLDELKELIASEKPILSPDTQTKLATALRRLIAFNNESQKEKSAFDAVGLGDCVYDADEQLEALRKALRLASRGTTKRSENGKQK
jgi:hypothetical protein